MNDDGNFQLLGNGGDAWSFSDDLDKEKFQAFEKLLQEARESDQDV